LKIGLCIKYFQVFFKKPKKRIIRICLNRIESMSLLWIQALEVKPQIELMEEKVRIKEPKVGIEPLVVVPIETIKIVVEKPNA